MSWITGLRARLRHMLRRAAAEERMNEEWRFHLEMESAQNVRDGMSPDEARRHAMISFGGVEKQKEAMRDDRRVPLLEEIWRDVAYAVRSLRRTPGFAGATALIIALGIGSTTAMLALVDAVLLQRLPVSDQDRVVVLTPTGQGTSTEHPIRLAQLDQFRRENRSLTAVAGVAHFGAWPFAISDRDQPLALRQARVTGNFFDVLGAAPALGRFLRTEDDVAGASPVMVISDDVWRRVFGRDTGVVGRTMTVNGFEWLYTIIGVAPPGLDYPSGVDYWIPIVPTQYVLVDVIGRLVTPMEPASARADFLGFLQRNSAQQPLGTPHPTGAVVQTLPDAILGNSRPIFTALTSAVGLLLLIMCVNVGGLLLLRGLARRRELAVRRALGASAAHIARQLFVENALLAILGGAIGLVLANAMLHLFPLVAPKDLPRLDVVRLAGAPLAIASIVTVVAVAIFGLAPALMSARGDLVTSLRDDVRAGPGTRRGQIHRQLLVASQVALAVIVVSAAGLLARSFIRLQRLDLGFEAKHLSILQLSVPFTKADNEAKLWSLYDSFSSRVSALPGVSSLTPLLITPFSGANVWSARVVADNQIAPDSTSGPVSLESVGPDYFRTFNQPILSGRPFTQADRENAPRVAIASETVARQYWAGGDVVGQRIRLASDTSANAWRTVVGVTRDIHFREHREPTPTLYLPYRQFFAQGFFAVRTTAELPAMLPSLRLAARSVDDEVVLWQAQTMDELLAGPLARPRLTAVILSSFALASLMLVAAGLYGLMATMVRQQSHEVGVRLALGATPGRVQRDVLAKALSTTIAGISVGIVIALAASRLFVKLLYQTSPADPGLLVGTCAILLLVACIAAYFPARRASQLNPIRALHSE